MKSKIKIEQLSKLSKGDQGIVCNYRNRFINMDELKKALKYKNPPKTPDMLYINRKKNEIWFIEFKSNKFDNLKPLKYDIKRKILDGIIVFYELFKDRFCSFSKNYIVVHKDFEDNEIEVMDNIINLSEYYDLKELEGKFLKYSNVLSCNEFKNLFINRFGITFKNTGGKNVSSRV